MSRHRALGNPDFASYPGDFIPTHCAGTTCFHPHPGERPWGTLPGLNVPVIPARCDRKGAHGAHDTTEGRCPGVAGHGLPAPRVVQRAAQARAAIRGGAR
jgi:hypothetical protein